MNIWLNQCHNILYQLICQKGECPSIMSVTVINKMSWLKQLGDAYFLDNSRWHSMIIESWQELKSVAHITFMIRSREEINVHITVCVQYFLCNYTGQCPNPNVVTYSGKCFPGQFQQSRQSLTDMLMGYLFHSSSLRNL